MITERQENFYEERVGKIYGMFEVIAVEYDEEIRKQRWTMRCTACGELRETVNGKDYIRGRNTGRCRCANKPKPEPKPKLDPNSLIGMVSGNWTVEKYVRGTGLYCRCNDCGNHSWRGIKPIVEQRDAGCAICTGAHTQKYNIEEWRGKKYWNLTIMDYVDKNFICRCDCGRIIKTRPQRLFDGTYKTCGNEDCFHHKVLQSVNSSTHGMSDTRLYGVLSSMRDRCNNPNNDHYHNYGGRGIKICPEWDDFDTFHDWAMSAGYNCTQKKGDCTLDRIDVNGNYEPGNCRWVDMKVQANNKRPRAKRMIEIDGRSMSKEEWCKEYGFTVPAIEYRMKKYGWNFEEAIKMPKHQGNPLKNSTEKQ